MNSSEPSSTDPSNIDPQADTSSQKKDLKIEGQTEQQVHLPKKPETSLVVNSQTVDPLGVDQAQDTPVVDAILAEQQQQYGKSICFNCHAAKVDSNRFCRHCGQKHTDLTDGVLHLVGDFLVQLLSVDGRAFSTLWNLLARPGVLTLEFINGRRVRYLSPIQIYLISSFAFFFAFSLWVEPPSVRELVNASASDTAVEKVGEIERQIRKATEDNAGDIADEVGLGPVELGSQASQPRSKQSGAPADAKQVAEGPETLPPALPKQDPSSDADRPAEAVDPKQTAGGNVTAVDPQVYGVSNASPLLQEKLETEINQGFFIWGGKKTPLTFEQFRGFATSSDDEIRAKLGGVGPSMPGWMTRVVRNASLMLTDFGVSQYLSAVFGAGSQVALIMMPLLAFAIRFLYWRNCPTLVIAFVLSSHLHATFYLLFAVMLLCGISWAWLLPVALVVLPVYSIATCRKVFAESYFWNVVKLTLVAAVYFPSVFVGAVIVSVISLYLL